MIENSEDLNQNFTTIVLQVFLDPLLKKSFQYTRNTIEDIL